MHITVDMTGHFFMLGSQHVMAAINCWAEPSCLKFRTAGYANAMRIGCSSEDWGFSVISLTNFALPLNPKTN